MKTLHIIQILSKVGKIVSKIVYICCIVGFIGCIVGACAMSFGVGVIKLGGDTLQSILETEAGISEGTIWAAIVVGMILCVGEYFVARKAYRYFDNELQAGTPFTENGAKELLHLGISMIWIPLAAIVGAQIAQEIVAQCWVNVEKVSLDGYDSVASGVTCLLVALLCRYGAEVKEGREIHDDECKTESFRGEQNGESNEEIEV